MFCIYIIATTPHADISEIKKNIVVILESPVAGDVLLKSVAVSMVEAVSIAEPVLIVEAVSMIELLSMPKSGVATVVSVSGGFNGKPEASRSDTSNGAD